MVLGLYTPDMVEIRVKSIFAFESEPVRLIRKKISQFQVFELF